MSLTKKQETALGFFLGFGLVGAQRKGPGMHALAKDQAALLVDLLPEREARLIRRLIAGEDDATIVADELAPVYGGHAILDLYFCSIVAGSDLVAGAGPEATESDLDTMTAEAWRLAISAVRTRPETGPVPAGVPAKGLE